MQALNLGVVDASYNYGFIYGNMDNDAGVYNDRGIAYSKKDEQDQAIASFNKAIQLDADLVEAYNNRGVVYAMSGKIDTAIEDFSTAIKLSPYYAQAYSNRGLAYFSKGSVNRAIEDCNKAIELDSDYAQAYNNRGVIYLSVDKVDRAIEDAATAINLDPDYALAYNNRGVVYFSKGNIDRAIEDFRKAIELDPVDATYYNNHGGAYIEIGEFDQAFKDSNKAIELQPNYAQAYNNRGVTYFSKGKLDLAIKDYNKAIELNCHYAEAYNHRGGAYGAKGELDKAFTDFRKAIELRPNYAGAYYNLGKAYGIMGETDLALQSYTRAVELHPNYADAYNNRGVTYKDKGEINKAIEDYNRAIEFKPGGAIAYNNRGVAYKDKGEVNKAIENYTQAIQLKQDYANPYYNRGEAWLHLREWDKAKADLTTAKQLGMDIIAMFHNSYKDVETYQKNRLVKLPEDLALLLTQRRRDRYPKLQKVLDADGNPLESPNVVSLREQLRNTGPPLSEYINAKSAFGINTTPTEVFVIDKATREELIAAHSSSADILKPFLHGQDIRRWHVDTPQQWLIFAHRGITIKDYPAILKYLEKHRESLQKRKGKQAWYELPASLRDVERFAQPKLVCPNVYNYQTFAVDTEGFYYGNTSYLIPTQEKWLCGLLNSRTVEWFYSQVSNQLTIDPLRARSGYIQQIPIPDITLGHKALIAKIVDYLIYLQQQPTTNSKDLRHARDAIMLGYFERIIDGLVYEAYLPAELHKSDKVFLQPLLDEGLPPIEEIQGDKMSAFRDIFELLYERTHLIRRNLYYLDSVKPIRIIQGKL